MTHVIRLVFPLRQYERSVVDVLVWYLRQQMVDAV
jgi:hypothetical protein